MSTLQYRSGPGGLLILYRQSASIEGAGTLVPNHTAGRLYYVDGPGGEVQRLYAFGVGGPVAHALTGALTADAAVVAATLARSGAPVAHALTGALVASDAVVAAILARSGAAVSHALIGALVAGDAEVTGVLSRGMPVTHDLTGALVADSAGILSCICVGPDEGIMAYSGTVSITRFNTRRVIDTAYRQCRLHAQNISAEMMAYARDALYLQLSELANGKPPSWCIEKVLLPMYQNQPVVTLPQGTVGVLNLNYRTLQVLTGDTTIEPTLYQVQFETATQVATVGLKWACCAAAVSFDVSADGVTWQQVGSQAGGIAGSHEWTWLDLSAPLPWLYFRITSTVPMDLDDVVLGNTPNEIPLGVLNRDGYVNQNNKIFPSRPTSYWFQRDLALPVLNLWPAPWQAAEHAQLVLWRHRHVMDVGVLAQALEVPQRWLRSVIATLAATLAAETPGVDASLIPVLEQKAAQALQIARDGDNDGAPSFYQAAIACYTR